MGIADAAHRLKAYKAEIESVLLAEFPDAAVRGPYNGDTGSGYSRGEWHVMVYLDAQNTWDVYKKTRDIQLRASDEGLSVVVVIEAREALRFLEKVPSQ